MASTALAVIKFLFVLRPITYSQHHITKRRVRRYAYNSVGCMVFGRTLVA